MIGAHGPTHLTAVDLQLGYGRRVVVDGLDLDIPAGRVTALVGANASGKSTVLRGLARLLRPGRGCVVLDGAELHRQPTREVARRIGVLPQSATAPAGITVEELVARGRAPHQTWLRQWTDDDAVAVEAAMDLTGITSLARRRVDELSGGQRQRVWLAMALAQQTPVLLLDEPTTYLDLAHQLDVLDLVAELNRMHGTTVVMVLHDLNHACRYADHLVALRDGAIVAAGPPAEVVDVALVRTVFGLDALVVADPATATPLVVPLPRRPPRRVA